MQAGEVHAQVTPSLAKKQPVRTDAEVLAALLFLSMHPHKWHVWSTHLSHNAAHVASSRSRSNPHKRLAPYKEHLRWRTDQTEDGPSVMVMWIP